MREEVTALGYAFGIDGISLADTCYSVGNSSTENKGQKKVIASGNLGNQEDGGHRSLHDTGHQPGHPHEGEVLFRQGKPAEIHSAGDQESKDRSLEKGRAKGPAHTSSGIGKRHAYDLEQKYKQQEHRHAPGRFHTQVATVQQFPYRFITLSEKRGEEPDKKGKAGPAHGPSDPWAA